MTRTVLIAPPSDVVEDDGRDPPLGLLYIASVLQAKGLYEVQILDFTGRAGGAGIEMGCLPLADVYGITCFCTNYPQTKRLVEVIRENVQHAVIVLGGPNPTALPEFTLFDSGADFVIVGEGEDAFAELVGSLHQGTLTGGVIRGRGRANIDSYPYPARELVDLKRYTRSLMNAPALSLLASRGCAHRCAHCNSVVMGGGNPQVRYRSGDNIANEIELFRDHFSHYRFTDDNFTGHPSLTGVLDRLKSLQISFRIFSRIEDLSPEICQKLVSAGCCHVTIGLESLNTLNLRVLGKSGQSQSLGNVKAAIAAGLTVRSSFIVGLPFDTDMSISESFENAASLGIHEFAVYPLIPYPGTRIAQHPERYGYRIVDHDFSHYVQIGRFGRTCFSLEHRNFAVEDVKRWCTKAKAILLSGGAIPAGESRVAQ